MLTEPAVFKFSYCENMRSSIWAWIMKRWILWHECLKGFLLLQLYNHLLIPSLQTWTTRTAWCQYGALARRVRQKTWGVNIHFEGVMMASFLWQLQSECLGNSFNLPEGFLPFHCAMKNLNKNHVIQALAYKAPSALWMIELYRNPSMDMRSTNLKQQAMKTPRWSDESSITTLIHLYLNKSLAHIRLPAVMNLIALHNGYTTGKHGCSHTLSGKHWKDTVSFMASPASSCKLVVTYVSSSVPFQRLRLFVQWI